MLMFILRRLGTIVLTMVCLTLIVFYMVNLDPNLEKLAKTQGSMRMTDAEVESWLEANGYREPFSRTLCVLARQFVQGDMGTVAALPAARERGHARAPRLYRHPDVLGAAGDGAGALIVGVLAGMREGSSLDRSLSVGSIASTSAPEYVTGIVFTVVFASALGWFKGVASTREITFENFTLPVLTMAIYGLGYIARMTRASMAEVMTSQYIRTARLKGLAFRDVVLKHALRNALIAPFTVIMLQFPWLLTGVVIVEAMFNYKGFGWLLVRAAENNDIDLLLACSCVAVVVVLLTQLISDIGYAYLNPRIRVS